MLFLTLALFVASLVQPPPPEADDAPRFAALVFTRTSGFRHGSIPVGVKVLQMMGREHDFTVVHAETPEPFTEDGLAPFDVVVFLNTTQDVLDEEQQAAFRAFVEDGGGFVGVHAATDTEYEWAWYGKLVGAYFSGHPSIQEAVVVVEDDAHPSTEMLPERWTRTDEWYNFRHSPRESVTVLASLDESTYEGGTMGDDHPVVWCHEFEGGRAWYTALGHTNESYAEPLFRRHLLGGLEWAAGVESKATTQPARPTTTDHDEP